MKPTSNELMTMTPKQKAETIKKLRLAQKKAEEEDEQNPELVKKKVL